MKLFNKVSILFASLALVMGAGLVGSNDAKEVKAAVPSDFEKITSIDGLNDNDITYLYCDSKNVGITGISGTKATASKSSDDWVKFIVKKSDTSFKLYDSSAKQYIAKMSSNSYGYDDIGGDFTFSSGIPVCNGRKLAANSTTYRMYTISQSYPAFFLYKSSTATIEPTITIDQDDATIEVGKTFALSATIEFVDSDPEIVWELDNNEIGEINSNGIFTSQKAGEVVITASMTIDGVKYTSNSIKITVIEISEEYYEQVTDISMLTIGTKIIFVDKSSSKVSSIFSKDYIDATDCSIDSKSGKISNLSDSAVSFTLDKDGDNWMFVNSDNKYLGATAAKKMSFTSGTKTWSISIDVDSGDATINSTNSGYGTILYNSLAPRFLNYTSKPTAAMRLPQLYRFVEKDTAEKFISDWQALRTAAGNEGICHYLSSANRAELDAMLERYETFSDADKAIIDAAKDGDTTIGNTITYVKNVIAGTQPTDKDYTNSGVIITSNYSIDSTSLIALFALLGIGAISAYYFIEKKKLSK